MKTSVVVLLVLLVAVISFGGWMLSRPDPLNGKMVSLEKELTESRAEITKLQDEIATQKKQAAARTLASNAAATLAAGKPNVGAPAKDGKATAEESGKDPLTAARRMMDNPALKELMQNPAMKEMMKQQSLARLDSKYARLFDHFNLNPEEKENFKQLLAARSSISTDIGMKLLNKDMTAEDKKKVSSEMTAARKASDEAIKTFLGNDEDYKTFQHWEDTSLERSQLDTMGGRAFFTSAGEPLTTAQEDKLVEVMSSIRKSSSKQPATNKAAIPSDGSMSDEFIQQQLEKMDREAASVAQNAAGFLSPAQLGALDKMQKQRRATTEAALKMSGAMLKSLK